MPFSLLPKVVATEVSDLTPERLCDMGIQLLMLDFDNTIVPYTTDIPSEKVLCWLERMKQSQIQLCVVSNSRKGRAVEFCRVHGIPCITRAKKPFTKGIRKSIAQFEVPESNCALVGDQIFTDTLGANRAGITSILVQAIDNHNVWLKLRHLAELPFIFLSRKRRIL